MSKPQNYVGIDAYTLTDRSLYRLLDQQEDGFRELPEDREFICLEPGIERKRLSRIRLGLRSLVHKRSGHAN